MIGMRVAIRVDTSPKIGTGHFMRCLTLAQGLSDRGARVRFVSRDLPEHLQKLLIRYGHELSMLVSNSRLGGDDLAHSHWLGTTQKADAEETATLLDDHRWDWLVVDHYAIDRRWESVLASHATRILVIDDLADRMHACDLLLDQNLIADYLVRYDGKVSKSCRLLLGPRYALLQPDYAAYAVTPAPDSVSKPVRRVLVYFGGADQHNLTGRAVTALIVLQRPDLHIDVILSTDSPHAKLMGEQVRNHAHIHLHGQLPSLADLMAKADLAIGACGATNWERLCLNIPALVVTLAANQRPIARELHRLNLIRWLGDQEEVHVAEILEALRELTDVRKVPVFSSGARLVDGRGAGRVISAMLAACHLPLQVRHATLADEALLLEWANDPVTRTQAFSGSAISPLTHAAWLRKRLDDSAHCRIFIAENREGVTIGQIRFDLSGKIWTVDYSLAPQARGHGLGRELLRAGLSQLLAEITDPVVVGEVKPDNAASRKVFESLGFSIRHADDRAVKYLLSSEGR